MKPHSQHVIAAADPPTGFLDAWQRLLGGAPSPTLPRRRGRKPRVPLTQVLPALTFHVMQGRGTLGEHFTELFDAPMADSSLADRRARLPWEIFDELMRRMLRRRATRSREPEAFWNGWRLVALDGTQWSLTNTPQIDAQVRKARTRRGRAAFARLTTAVLLELGLHNPLAAAIGRNGESEWALALTLLAHVPAGALMLADRLYGCAAFAAPLHAACQRVGSHFLIRAQRVVKGRVTARLRDGSRVLQVPITRRYRPTPETTTLTVREIRVRVGRPGRRATELRLWTSLMDPRHAPALDLARLYAHRWEHELYFREMKRHLRRTDLLQSHTLETAAQEIAAIVLASALLAVERTRVANGALPALRVSFAKILRVVEGMWFTLDIAAPVLQERQTKYILKKMYERMQHYITPRRRARSCPRAVRQPVTGWPRLMKNTSVEGPFEFTVV
jgi:hypothetical protein